MADLLFVGIVVESKTVCSERCVHFRAQNKSDGDWSRSHRKGRCKLFNDFVAPDANGNPWRVPDCMRLAESLVVIRAKNAWHNWTEADTQTELRGLDDTWPDPPPIDDDLWSDPDL
jgi:hypothetical protein